MNKAIATALILALTSIAQAKIDVAARISTANSMQAEATHLTKVLKSLGAKGFLSVTHNQEISLKGKVTITNGAACDNGRRTYGVELVELDEKGSEVRTIHVDDSGGCTKPSVAEKFSALLDKWGASTLEGDCGAGHCWENIDSIDCTHFDASTPQEKTFDSCNVVTSTNQ